VPSHALLSSRSQVTRRSLPDRRHFLRPLQFKTSNDNVKTRVKEDVQEIEDEDEDDNGNDSGSDILQKLSKGVIPLAASVGFAATPSSRIVARFAGAAAGGIVGLLAKKAIQVANKPITKFNNGRFDAGGAGGSVAGSVKKATAHLERMPEPAVSLTLKQLEMVAKKYRVGESELGAFFTHAFSNVIYSAVGEDTMDVTELSEVMDFAALIGLMPAEIGDGFALAAIRVGALLDKDEMGFFEKQTTLDVLYQASKMFFLADKMVGSTKGFYGKRIGTAMSYFPMDTYQETITEACTALFSRCIETVLLNPDAIAAEEVQYLQKFLTTSSAASSLRPANMQNLIMEAVQFTLDASITPGASAFDVKVENYDNFLKAQSVLGWNAREWKETLEIRTTPLFETVVQQVFVDVQDKPDRAEELAAVLKERVAALNVDPRKARIMLTTMVSKLNEEYMSRIDKVYTAADNTVEPAFKIMAAYANQHEAFVTLTAGLLEDSDVPMPGLPFTDMVRAAMYQFKVTKGGKADQISSSMFDLDEAQMQTVRKHMALPRVTSWITQCITEGSFAPEARNAYRKLLTEYGVTDEEWRSTAIDFYYQDVSRIANMRAVPSQADIERINALKVFLDCAEETVAKVNLELLGDKYVKALTEAMTPTGVVTEEYIDGLARLQARLGLSEEDADKLLGVATRARIGPIIKDLSNIWKSDTDANFRRDMEKKQKAEGKGPKDKSGDPISDPDNVFGYMEMGGQKDGGGPNVFMREALNLVDFFKENYIVQGRELETEEDLRVTASGFAPEDDLAGMFKHYLITRLGEADPALRQRYLADEPWFAKVLGITVEGQKLVKESLAYSAYKSLLMNVLTYKGTVEQQDIGQFMLLKDSLQLDKEVADKVYDEATRGAVVEHTAKLIRRAEDGESFSAEMAVRLRQQVQSLGLEMQKDTGFSTTILTYLYALEVQVMVDNGLEGDLTEVQEAYDIPDDRAADIVEACCKRYVNQLLNFALRGAKRYNEQDTIKWVKRIIKYAVFISTPVEADGSMFDDDDKKRMISFYQTEVANGEDAELLALVEQYGDMADKFREMINVTDDYVSPISGIDGLLGNVRRLDQLEDDMKDTDAKKNWAWG